MKKYLKAACAVFFLLVMAMGCGKGENKREEVMTKNYEDILPQELQPVIVRDGTHTDGEQEADDADDFSLFLNNGAVTDYAMLLLGYDIDFGSPDLNCTGFSAVRDNHLVLFVEAEHAMGDYVELEFADSGLLSGSR